MARSWSGFLPQNQEIKEQWGVLEETQAQIYRRLHEFAASPLLDEEVDTSEAEDFRVRVTKP